MGQMAQLMQNGNFSFLKQTKSSQGFTYIGVLAVLSVMMIAMGAVAQVWHTQMQHENEQELLFIGHEFREAIGKYYVQSGRGFPTSLAVLTGAEGDAKLNPRYLRKIYRDPFTGSNEWGVVLGINAEIVGIHSLSEMAPYKTADFSDKDSTLEGKKKYSEWEFIYTPQKTPAAAAGITGAIDTVNGIARSVPRNGLSNADVSNNAGVTNASATNAGTSTGGSGSRVPSSRGIGLNNP